MNSRAGEPAGERAIVGATIHSNCATQADDRGIRGRARERDELLRNLCADRRADRRRRVVVAAEAGRRARAGLGQRAGDTGGEAPGRHPDAQDADGQRVGRRAEAGGRAGAQGQCVRDRSRSIRAGSTCCPMATSSLPRRSRPRSGEERVRLRDAGDDAARGCAWRQREPHHAVARQGRRRRRRNARRSSWRG